MNLRRRGARFAALAAGLLAFPAWAEVSLRVEARPISEPIEAFVTVTTGDPPAAVPGLTAADFAVTLDGDVIAIAPGDLTLPPAQGTGQVSVVFAMDYTSSVTDVALTAMTTSVKTFIDEMEAGDFAAIIKFNGTQGAVVVHEFVQIDDGGPNDDSLKVAVDDDFDFNQGDGSNILDAAVAAVGEFAAPPQPLPAGPKAVILLTDGEDTNSEATQIEVVTAANDNSIPLFSIGVADPNQAGLNLLTSLAADTGGEFIEAPDDQAIADAYATIQFLLTSEYLLTINDTSITDCEEHTLEVTVDPHGSDSATFTRRACDTTPNAFSFTSETDLETGVSATSNAVTISGLEAPTAISIDIGAYSIGCGDAASFTSADGTIEDGDTVCVRHTTSTAFSTTKVTTLTIGGESGTFSTTTEDDPGGGGGGGGGGGATGVLELLLGLGLLLARRRRIA